LKLFVVFKGKGAELVAFFFFYYPSAVTVPLKPGWCGCLPNPPENFADDAPTPVPPHRNRFVVFLFGRWSGR
jgi:hypothetical protein